jgi:hypothetical protein
MREVAPQSLWQIMEALGYEQTNPARRRTPLAAQPRRRVEAVRSHSYRSVRLPRQPKVPVVWRDG